MSSGWSGEIVRLVPLDVEKHFANALAWMNDPEVTEFLYFGDFPMGELAEKAFFDRMTGPFDSDVLFAITTHGGQHIGFSGIHKIDFRHGIAQTGTVIGVKDHWGKGFGSDACKVRSRYIFDVLGLRMVLSECFEGNERSLRMQKRAGYKEYGRCPKRLWKRGAYRDMILTHLTREDWESTVRG